MDYRIEAACGSSIGKVRSNNEDNFLFDCTYLPQENGGQLPPLQMYGSFAGNVCIAVFDGMGGGDYGEVASYKAAVRLKELLSEMAAPDLRDAVDQLNLAVWNARTETGSRQMGSTMAAVFLQGKQAVFCNVGDSRIFIMRGDKLIQVSQDHTDEAYMKAKQITGRRPRLTQYLGMDPGQVRLDPYITKGVPEAGDLILICSDGLTDMLSQEEICTVLTAGGTAVACVEELIAQALEKGGKDNVTVIVCRFLEQEEQRREAYDQSRDQNTLERLGDLGLSWGRKLWDRLRDTARDHRN